MVSSISTSSILTSSSSSITGAVTRPPPRALPFGDRVFVSPRPKYNKNEKMALKKKKKKYVIENEAHLSFQFFLLLANAC